jgi:hypothetical protein
VVQLVVAFPAGCAGFVRAGVAETLVRLMRNSVNFKFATRAVRTLEGLLSASEDAQDTLARAGLVDAILAVMHRDVTACVGAVVLDPNARAAQRVVAQLLDDVAAPQEGSGQLPEQPQPRNAQQVPLGNEQRSLLKMVIRLLRGLCEIPAFAPQLRNAVSSWLLADMDALLRHDGLFGASVWCQAARWITAFANAEPNLVNVLQEHGLLETAVWAAKRGLPVSAEALIEYPSLLAALVLNQQGLPYLESADPFGSLAATLASEKYLTVISVDVSRELGPAVDELWRHQPTMRASGIRAICSVLDALLALGQKDGIRVVPGKRERCPLALSSPVLAA